MLIFRIVFSKLNIDKTNHNSDFYVEHVSFVCPTAQKVGNPCAMAKIHIIPPII